MQIQTRAIETGPSVTITSVNKYYFNDSPHVENLTTCCSGINISTILTIGGFRGRGHVPPDGFLWYYPESMLPTSFWPIKIVNFRARFARFTVEDTRTRFDVYREVWPLLPLFTPKILIFLCALPEINPGSAQLLTSSRSMYLPHDCSRASSQISYDIA